MGYVEKNLVQGETVLYKTGLHWIVLIVPLIVSLVLGVFGLAFVIGGYEASGKRGSYPGMIIVGLLILVGGGVLIGAGFIRKLSTDVVLSNKRVLIKSGLINRKSIEVVLHKVESIGVDESALGRLLGYGGVTLRGTGGTFEKFGTIANPNEFRRQVQQQISG